MKVVRKALGRRLLIAVVVIALVGAGLKYGVHELEAWSLRDHESKAEVVVHFPKGTALRDLAALLEKEGLVSSGLRFRLWVRLAGNYPRFQAGNYRFGPGPISPEKIRKDMVKGAVILPVVLQLTIPEGFNIRQVAARMAQAGLGTETEILQLLNDQNLARSLKVEARSLEGYLYPATYNFTVMPTAKTVITEMVNTFWARLPANYLQDLAAVGLTLHQAVTFASLIELETMLDEEKAKVSEVIWRRLKANDAIAIDAALIYGIKGYQGDIKWQHLRDKSNLYNTRIHRGLPPGPIGSPDTSSLEAVLKPSTNGYYYYVLIPDGQTRHHFSTSLSEHNRYVKMLLEAEKSKSAAKRP